ncbi:hypothetical protein KFE25_010328 [Diacronema lutheri]|uniref:RCC1-like domain-containing protein n=2 Tax=Diacronema lutheri TaxID=2081491 RepID=A0A8J6CCH8_DIALT|nr:hypothetical protein KFE25_010328 [Diacronema lutheri]
MDVLGDDVLAHALHFVGADSLARAACVSRRFAAAAADAFMFTCRELRVTPPPVDGWSASRKLRLVEARMRAAAQAPLLSAGRAHFARVLEDGTVVVTAGGAVAGAGCTAADGGTVDHAAPKAAPRVRAPRAPRAAATGADGRDVLRVISAAAGDGFTLVATADGEAFAWGDSTDGALGLGPARGLAHVREPRAVGALAVERVVGVAAGFSHSLFVTAAGRVYSAGWAHGGRLGLGAPHAAAFAPVGAPLSGEDDASERDEHSSAVPQLISSLAARAHAIGAWAGEDHSIVVDSDGYAWTFGQGLDGQLGHAQEALAHADGFGAPRARLACALDEPRRVLGALEATAVVAAAAGASHSLFLAADGALYACGCGGDGRLGLGDGVSRAQPERVTLGDESTCAVACAAGARHSAAIDECGGLWLWGALPDGWQALAADGEAAWAPARAPPAPAVAGSTVVVERPSRAPALLPAGVRAAAVACGDGYTIVLGDDGECYALGEPDVDEDASSDGTADADVEAFAGLGALAAEGELSPA